MSIITELRAELASILNYWISNTKDQENGGFVGEISSDNIVTPNATKGAVLNTRILWTFSAAYRFDPKPEYLEMAQRAYDYIVKYFWDIENGGVYWELDAKGNPINTRKQIYAQGFALYGFSEFYRATQNAESLDYAKKTFALIEKYSFDSVHSGYIEALSKDWQPMDDMRLSKKDENTPKSMNTHLHIIEPYTNLYRVWKDETLGKKIEGLIDVFLTNIIDSEGCHFKLFFEKNWDVLPSAVSYGHDIEGTWLLVEAAEVYGNKELLHKAEAIAVKMSDKVLQNGIDADGSIFYELHLANNHLDSDKHWWPQAEGMVGFLNSYQITKDERYLEEMKKLWEFIKNNIVDKSHGEWFWLVRKNGSICKEGVKVGFWKCPYHNSRALIETIERLEKI
jgi:mannobiose 2-epimerase